MKANFAAVVAVNGLIAGASAQLLGLDIEGLLKSLGPAPDTDPRFTTWKAAGPGDVRSPCPGLNALANHGFINHNGKDLTIPHLLKGLSAGLNIGPDFTTVIGALGLLSSPNPLGGAFDLNDLDQHNFPIEHDGSLSRADAYFGNDYSFNETNFDQFFSHFNGVPTTTLTASQAPWARVNDSLTHNPEVVYGLREFVVSGGETGLYVQSLSSPSKASVPLSYIKSLFVDEKLPFHLGWRPSPEPVTLLSLGSYILELFAANPDKFAEGAALTEYSYLNLFEVTVGGSEVLANLTQGISTALGL